MSTECRKGTSWLIARKKIMEPYSSLLVIVHYVIKKQVASFQKSERKGNPCIVIGFEENLHGSFVYDLLRDQLCIDVYITGRVIRYCTAAGR